MNSKFCTYKRVGYLKRRVANELGIEFTGIIYASPGVLKHIIRRHGKQLDYANIGDIVDSMRRIIEEPDYIGLYINKKGQMSVDFIKKIGTNVLLGIELDEVNEYIYVTTMYPISEGKMEKKIYNGKLIQTNTIYNCS